VSVDSADVKSWEHLAWAAYKQNKAQDALAAAQSALALDPNDAAALALKAYAEDALGQRAQAAADIKAAAGLDRAFASRAARADGQDRLCAPEEELVDAPGAARGRTSGLPSWVPWIGGAMLVGLGLSLALISALKGGAPPPPQAS
jgi:tetratricopeptide (TPR) repeat protein